MENSRYAGSKEGVQNMLFYYLVSLMEETDDPKQIIATELPKMIDLSEDQARYVATHINTNGKALESLESSIKLLKKMKSKKEFDKDSLSIVVKLLLKLKEEMNKAIELFVVKPSPEQNDK